MNEYHIWQQELQSNQLTMINLSYIIPDMKTNTDNKIEVHNPYSGQSAMLTEEENKLYLSIKLAEMRSDTILCKSNWISLAD